MVERDILRQQKGGKGVMTDSQRQRQGRSERGGLAERVSLGLLVLAVITSISHSQSFQGCSALS